MSNSNFKIRPDTIRLPENISVETITIKKAVTQPVPPPGANVIYNDSGFLIFKGENGTITTIANK